MRDWETPFGFPSRGSPRRGLCRLRDTEELALAGAWSLTGELPYLRSYEVDLVSLATSVEKYLAGIQKSVKVAVMGCVVNGPGEARDADIGIACGKGKAVIFRKGQPVRTVDEADVLSELMREIEQF